MQIYNCHSLSKKDSNTTEEFYPYYNKLLNTEKLLNKCNGIVPNLSGKMLKSEDPLGLDLVPMKDRGTTRIQMCFYRFVINFFY